MSLLRHSKAKGVAQLEARRQSPIVCSAFMACGCARVLQAVIAGACRCRHWPLSKSGTPWRLYARRRKMFCQFQCTLLLQKQTAHPLKQLPSEALLSTVTACSSDRGICQNTKTPWYLMQGNICTPSVLHTRLQCIQPFVPRTQSHLLTQQHIIYLPVPHNAERLWLSCTSAW